MRRFFPPTLEILEDRLVPSSLDLTTPGAQGTIGGALFEQGDVQPAGSGVIQSFVRIHALGNAPQEQGYNTDARPLQFDENNSPNFTRSIQLSDVPLVKVNGVNYRAFLLDINQKSSQPLVSLDQLQIFVAGGGNLKSYDTTARLLTGASLLFDMNPGGGNSNWVELNARLSHGSGSSDMTLLVPDSLFASTGGDPHVYLFSHFGGQSTMHTNGGYEEWAVSKLSGPASSLISGTVLDNNNAPVSGATVELTGFDVNGNLVTLFATTNASGFYFFGSLTAGTSYTIIETPPSGYANHQSIAGSLGGLSDLNQISGINLGSGLNGIDYNFFDNTHGY